MKKLLRIQENQNKTFKNIARQFDIEYKLVKQITDFKGDVQFCYSILSPIVNTDLKTVNSYISLRVEYRQAILNAKVLYSLYATLNLRVVDFKYPTYNHFFNAHIDLVDGDESLVSVDHRLPISIYPHLTFNATNWLNISKEANRLKSNKSERSRMVHYHDLLEKSLKNDLESLGLKL